MHVAVILFLSNLFSSDMVLILVVALFLFGGEKLPELARGVGKGVRDFKEAAESVKSEINAQINIHESDEDRRIARSIAATQAEAARKRQENNFLTENNKPAEIEAVQNDILIKNS
jgi:sec-independent protein translocase protein TatA